MSLRTTFDIDQHLRTVLGLTKKSLPRGLKRLSSSQENGSDNDIDETDLDDGFTQQNDFDTNTATEELETRGGDINQTGGAESDDDDDTNSAAQNVSSDLDIAVPHPLFRRGRDIYSDDAYIAHVKAVSHKRRTQYSLSDHIFDLTIAPKNKHTNQRPYLINLEEIIGEALIKILDRLKTAYKRTIKQNQVYITIIEKHIIKGINSGNYLLTTPSLDIASWVLALLYHYLKSRQTMRLNNSFKIQVKIISARHASDLQNKRKKPSFVRHTYH